MSYYDNCERSGDIDRLQSDVSNLDYDIRRVKEDLEYDIRSLKQTINDLLERIRILESQD